MNIEITKKYELFFHFEKQYCTVDLEVISPDEIRINSRTDGYHWLQYLLSQEPGTFEMENYSYEQQITICEKLFKDCVDAKYVQEDKETAFLRFGREFDDSDIETISEVIYTRFANRERFFPESQR